MRLIYQFLAASFIISGKETESRTTSGDQPSDTTFDLLTDSTRRETTASVELNPLKPDDFPIEGIEQNNEQRSRPPLSLSPALQLGRGPGRHVQAVVNALTRGTALKMLGLTEKKLARSKEDTAKLVGLLVKIKELRARGFSFDDKAVIHVLATESNARKLAIILHRFRDEPSVKVFSQGLQRELAAMHPDTIKTMSNLWLRSKVSPEEVFILLPIGAMKRDVPHDVVRGPIVYKNLMQWIRYVVPYQAQNSKYTDEAVVKLLVEKRGLEETMAFFHRLRGDTDLNDFANRLQKVLCAGYPEAVPKLKKLWLETNTKPEKVFTLMPISSARNFQMAVDVKKWYVDMIFVHRQWLQYVQLFRSQAKVKDHSFDDNAIIKLLLRHNHTSQQDLAHVLRMIRDPDVEGLVAALLATLKITPDRKW